MRTIWLSIGTSVLALDLAPKSEAQNSAPKSGGPIRLEREIARLRDRKADTRYDAAMSIARCGPAAARAVPALIRAAADRDTDVRRATARALACLGSRPERSVPALLRLLKDPDKDVRSQAVASLTAFPGMADRILPRFVAGIGGSDRFMRFHYLQWVGNFGGKAIPAVPAVARALDDKEATYRTVAANALRQIKPVTHDPGSERFQ